MDPVIQFAPTNWPHADAEPTFESYEKYAIIRIKKADKLFSFYALTPNEDTVWVVARLDDSFESLTLQDDDDMNAIADLYPTIAGLIRNGLNEQLGDCAMIRVRDIDIGERRWFLITSAGGIEQDLDNPETQKSLMNAVGRLISGLDIVRISIKNAPGMGATMAKGFWRGLRTSFHQTPQILVTESLKIFLGTAFKSELRPGQKGDNS